MIPKKIHYCWFGKNPKPQKILDCIDSWRKFLPEYVIIEWNEKNFDISQNMYAREAYEAQKYAFVSDFARLKILYDEGGTLILKSCKILIIFCIMAPLWVLNTENF